MTITVDARCASDAVRMSVRVEQAERVLALLSDSTLDAEDSAMVCASLLSDVRVRDLVIRELCADRFVRDDAHVVLSQLVEHCGEGRAVSGPAAARVLTLAGMVSWVAASAKEARFLLQDALTMDPDYALAHLLLMALVMDTRPEVWCGCVTSMSREHVLDPQAYPV